jgi:peptidoglycan/xylan/chitin deacetylase (PgdA/CDA1 family)
MAKLLGLRVDVDTHEGMRDGVPRLLDILGSAGVKASFYLAMGPDRSGRAIFNLLKPGFLKKMGRSGAASIYSKRTMLSGTLLPARPVATAFPDTARRIAAEGHDVGIHGWDHRSWQDRLLSYPDSRVANELDRARETFRSTFGKDPITAAAPAWLTDDRALLHQDGFGMAYATDCRGMEPFLPVIRGHVLKTPQVPATLPTLDEAIGNTCVSARDYFTLVRDESARQLWPVLTVHAEIEGGPYEKPFQNLLEDAGGVGLRCVTLGELLRERISSGPLSKCPMTYAPVPNRHGVVSTQGPPL